jgi:flavin reductase
MTPQTLTDHPDPDLVARFKSSMRCVASTVSVITARGAERAEGMTATSVTSLTAVPPTLLVCVNRAASLGSTMNKAKEFCVNVLATSHEDVSRVFSDSTRREERFNVGHWIIEDNEPPYLEDAQANLFCCRIGEIPFETHVVYIGRVYGASFRHPITPLVYLNGSYKAYANA